MATAKVAITLEEKILKVLDRWVMQRRYRSRSQAIQAALQEKMERWRRTRLADELAKIDPKEERALANESFMAETWHES